MRSFALALLIVAASASPASAAVISFDDRSAPEDNDPTFAIVVRAAPGETNSMTLRAVPGGILIEDTGAPLTGECAPQGAGRFCEGYFAGADVYLGDGDDTLDDRVFGVAQGEGGDDDIRVSNGFFTMIGGPGADRLDATNADGAGVTYLDRTDGVTVRLNGLADDGSAGEGDNVLGTITGITGSRGNDFLEAGASAISIYGAEGDDTIVGGPMNDYLSGLDGDDDISGGEGDDSMLGGAGADVFTGGGGFDGVGYDTGAPLRLTIGDGANDGAAGEGDDIRADVEGVSGGGGDDLIVGDDAANSLSGGFGHDVLRGEGGADLLLGWGDGDVLDAGPGEDTVRSRLRRHGLDRALLTDGEADTLDCVGRAMFIEADADDALRSCAPAPTVRARGRLRRHRRLTLVLRCPEDTAVACRGRVWLELRSGRRVSPRVRFGPLEADERGRVRVLLRGRMRGRRCVDAKIATRRDDGLVTRTVVRSRVACLG
jgi:hemolysin type calcium-binding protein